MRQTSLSTPWMDYNQPYLAISYSPLTGRNFIWCLIYELQFNNVVHVYSKCHSCRHTFWGFQDTYKPPRIEADHAAQKFSNTNNTEHSSSDQVGITQLETETDPSNASLKPTAYLTQQEHPKGLNWGWHYWLLLFDQNTENTSILKELYQKV